MNADIRLSLINAASFVSIKLSGRSNYTPWRTQIVCLLQSHDLLGFVDGRIQRYRQIIAPAVLEQWNRIDELVKACIFGSLTDQLLKDRAIHKPDTAEQVWLVLKQRYDPNFQGGRCINQIERIRLNDNSIHLPLFRALLSRDCEKANTFLTSYVSTNIASINTHSLTALHLAVGVKSEKGNEFVRYLATNITDRKAIANIDCYGETALHYAARFGNVDAAKILVNKQPDLQYTANTDGLYPIHHAARCGHDSRDVYIHFKTITRFNDNRAPYTDYSGVKLLYRLVESNLYDFATELVEECPDLAKYATDGRSALKNLANKEFTFVRGSHLHFWRQFLYCRVPIRSTSRSLQRRPNANDPENDSQMANTKYGRIYFSIAINKLHTLLFVVLECLVPHLKRVRDKKSIHHNAFKYATCLCEQIESLSDQEVESIAGSSLLDAAFYDNYKLVELLLRNFPNLVYYDDQNQKNILHIAIENRCKNVFKVVCQMSQLLDHLVVAVDSSDNSILDLAGKLAPPNKLNLVSGPAFQMQRELQWFKEVKQMVPPPYWERLNREEKAPYMVFTEEHEKLKADGEKWMKETSSSCTIAAALIATIAFAAAITVPGGNEQQGGLPVFSGNIAFIIFAISNAAALFTSSTSLLVFLSILTSRYAEEDFLHTLPRSLIQGLLTLFLSITSMIISFSATVYLMYGQKKAWVLLPVATMACLPITSFALLQFPLLVDLISLTYGAGIYGN